MAPEYPAVPIKISSDQSRLTQRKLNRLYRRFWRQESELMTRRIADPAIYASAMSSMASENQRGVPLRNRKCLGPALADAERDKNQFLSEYIRTGAEAAERNARIELARKGGKAPKADALSVLIQKLTLLNSKITEKELLTELEREVGQGTIVSIDAESQTLVGDGRKIHFEDEDGTPKTASVSGLKDRLTRAKAKIRANQLARLRGK